MITAIIPWKAGCPHRERALRWTLPRLAPLVDEVVIGEITGEWSKARAVARALEHANGDVLAIVDADVWITDPTWVDACEAALVGWGWAVPHTWLYRWTPIATQKIYQGDTPASDEVTRPRYRGWLGGGTVVLPRALYDAVPLDPRFAGWGQEDESWALALTTMCGKPWRGDADMWHLYHPPAPRQNIRWGSHESIELYRRYKQASGDPNAMRELLEEVR